MQDVTTAKNLNSAYKQTERPADDPGSAATEESLRSVHTSNLPDIFERLGISLVVSTYQAGKVILVRNEGGVINTHFRTFSKPMGIAADFARLAIGGTNTVWYYRNVPALASKIEPKEKHANCFIPRRVHVTGDMANNRPNSRLHKRHGFLWPSCLYRSIPGEGERGVQRHSPGGKA